MNRIKALSTNIPHTKRNGQVGTEISFLNAIGSVGRLSRSNLLRVYTTFTAFEKDIMEFHLAVRKPTFIVLQRFKG